MPLKRDENGVWYADLYAGPPGRRRRVRRSARTTDRREAQEFYDRIRADLWRQDQLGERPRHSWREAVVSYMTGREARSSYSQDVQRLRWLDPHLGDLMLDEVSSDVLERVKQARMAEAAPSTVNRLLVLVRAILNHAADREWIDRVPKVRSVPDAGRRLEWLTPGEADALLSELDGHLRAFTELALCTGLRMRNITRLEWSQVDMQRQCAWIHSDQAKARRAIPIPLTRRAMDVLRDQIGNHPTRALVYRGRPFDRVNQRSLQRAADRAGIQKHVHPHLFRHTWASWHIMAGTSLAELQALGGWSKVESVLIYAHLSADHLRQAAERSGFGGKQWMETSDAT